MAFVKHWGKNRFAGTRAGCSTVPGPTSEVVSAGRWRPGACPPGSSPCASAASMTSAVTVKGYLILQAEASVHGVQGRLQVPRVTSQDQ
jgi:hypothetical protein